MPLRAWKLFGQLFWLALLSLGGLIGVGYASRRKRKIG